MRTTTTTFVDTQDPVHLVAVIAFLAGGAGALLAVTLRASDMPDETWTPDASTVTLHPSPRRYARTM
jgi:hypothetical protein